jgi:hypothetical protein
MDLRKDIYFYADFASFPASGAANLLYVDSATSLIYIWNGASYVASGAGGLKYLGLWDANANSPLITSGVGNIGEYYIVGTAGTTNIDGINDWGVGDWIIFGGSAWQKIDNSDREGYNLIQEEGVSLPQESTIDFVGAGVSASAGSGKTIITIPGSIGATVYYMNQTVTQAPYKEFSSTGTVAAEQVIPATVAGGATATIASFLTPSGVPNTTVIPQGLWQLFLHFNAGSAGQNWIIRPYVYKRDLGGIETLIFTPDPEIVTSMSTTTTMYTCDGVFPTTTLLTTDRIVVKINVQNTTGVSQTANFRTEGSQHYSVATTTLNQAVPTGGVTSVTGTAPVVSSGGTTPAISMAAANGSTNGYLTSTDWTTFNGKQNAITLTTTGTSGASTLIGSTLNIPQYAGGLTYFTEAQNTAAPNATVPVDSLTALSATTNADAAIVPKGTGAFMLDIPNNTTTGGNKRGQYAVDLQHGPRANADKVASGDYSVVIGRDNRSYAPYAVGIGYGTFSGGNFSTAFQSATATGNFAFAHGQRATASGTASVSIGGYGFADNIASGDNSFAAGASTASGLFSIATGESNTASGQGSTAVGGRNNLANAYLSSVSGGYCTANAVEGRQVRGRALGTVVGETQKSEFFLSIRTTGNTPAAVTVAGGSPGTSNQVILSNNSAYRFKGTILGKQSGSTNAAAWDVDGLIVRGANAVSTTLVVSNVNLVSNASSWGTPTLSADPFNGGLQVQVTGVAATNIQWTAIIETTEVIYA